MGFRIPVFGKSYEQVAAAAYPQVAGQPEAVPWIFYDSETYVDASTTTLTFFQTTKNDRSLSNMEVAGSIPNPQAFQLYYTGLDVLRAPTTAAGGVAGAIDDIHRLVLTGRPRFTLILSDKNYGPFPLSFLHASGGAIGFGWGTFTAEESIQYANNGVFDGGFCWDGSIIIPPSTGFRWVVEWPSAVDITADVVLRLWIGGALFRAVK